MTMTTPTATAGVIDTAEPVGVSLEVAPSSVVQPARIGDLPSLWTLAQQICRTEFVPKGLRGRPEAVMAAILHGREVGWGPMASLKHINVIEGTPSLDGEGMAGLIRARGHSLTVDESPGQASVTGTRADSGDTFTSVWTMNRARDAGLVGKTNWKTYPETMLRWRATSEVARFLFADVIGGMSYTPEEVGSWLSAEEMSGEGENASPGGAPSPEPADPNQITAFRARCSEIARLDLFPSDMTADDLRHRIVERATRGRTESSGDLLKSDLAEVWRNCDRASAQFGG